jgi:hypothetical protein
MACPVCGHRKPKRTCPALGQTICPVCCATKRQVEIHCPDDCVHLTAGREHPAAVVRRQQERDVAVLLPSISHLTERQHQLFFLFQTVVARHQPEGFVRLNDDDVAEAAATVAATLETAARGVIYEHTAPSPVAQRLARELQALLEEMKERGATVFDREAAIVLRAIEQGARETRAADRDAGEARTGNPAPTAYLTLMGRLLHVNRAADAAGASAASKPAGQIVLP